jgi:hypothetical protein
MQIFYNPNKATKHRTATDKREGPTNNSRGRNRTSMTSSMKKKKKMIMMMTMTTMIDKFKIVLDITCLR